MIRHVRSRWWSRRAPKARERSSSARSASRYWTAPYWRSKKLFIVSANNEEPISSYVRDGYYARGTITMSHSEHAQLAMNGIVKALAGSPVPEHLVLTAGDLLTSD